LGFGRNMAATSGAAVATRQRSITVTPLIGAGTHGGGARSCLLHLGRGDGLRPVRILVDCGWDAQFKQSSVARLKQAVLSKEEPIDLILISFGDLEHIGALPLVVGRLGLKVPVFCTLPTRSMGYQVHVSAQFCTRHTLFFFVFIILRINIFVCCELRLCTKHLNASPQHRQTTLRPPVAEPAEPTEGVSPATMGTLPTMEVVVFPHSPLMTWMKHSRR
jgi:hypothetical protein